LSVDDKQEKIDVLTSFHTLVIFKAHIDQFLDGLDYLKLYSHMNKYPDLMRSLSIDDDRRLTAGSI
jgi:hypothetical protein